MSCKNDNLYNSLAWCTGRRVLPGIRKRLYYIPKSDIVKWPVLPNAPEKDGNISEIVTYKGDFTLAADAKWRYIEVVTGESPVSSEAQGEMPSQTSLNKGTFKYPSIEEEATAFAKQANNDDLVYCYQSAGGRYRIIGNEMYLTTTKVKQEHGATVTDKAGTTIETECTDLCPPPFYTGKLLTEEGELDCSTGELTSPIV